MNILLIHPHDIYSLQEPWTVRIVSLSKEFIKRGHQVKIIYFVLNSDKTRQNSFHLDNVECIPLKRSGGPLLYFRNLYAVIKITQWADFVHFQKCFHWAAIPALVAAYLKGKSIHYDWDDWEEKIWYESLRAHSFPSAIHIFIIGMFLKILERVIPNLVDTISVSSRSLHKLALNYEVQNKRIFHAPVGADLDFFPLCLNYDDLKEKYRPENKKVVLYIGQLHGAQYVDLFIKAANIVLHRYPEVLFMVVGEGFRFKSLKNLAAELGIENKVIFAGAVPHGQIPKYISFADVCVACFKDTDAARCKSPLKIAEYLACGKAIVASNVGEVRNMVGGVGLLVKAGDYKEIAQGILKILHDDLLKTEMEKRARRRAELKYNWAQTAGNLLSAYEYVRKK